MSERRILMGNKTRVSIVLLVWVFFASAAGAFDEVWQAISWIFLSSLLCTIGLILVVDPRLDD